MASHYGHAWTLICTSDGLDPELKTGLLGLISDAHAGAAFTNDNISNAAVCLASKGAGDFGKAVIAGVSTLGRVHAPVTAARRMIYGTSARSFSARLESGKPIPGWGNSFFKDGIDPAFAEIDEFLRVHFPEDAKRLDDFTEIIEKKKGKKIYPNAAAYTAIVAELLGMPAGTEAVLVVSARLPVWAILFHVTLHPSAKETKDAE